MILAAGAIAVGACPSAASASSHGAHSQPKLVVKSVSGSPNRLSVGGSITLTDQTKNAGKTRTKRSITAYLLSPGTGSGEAGNLLGTRRVPRLRPGRSSSRSLTVPLSRSIPAGIYQLSACANYQPKTKRRKAKNSCRVASTAVTLTAAAAVSAPCTPNAGGPVNGIDVSSVNGSVNFAQVASSGVKFVFARADDGTMLSDANYATYKAGAAAASLTFGAYQFFEASQDPVAQANKFLSDAALGSGNLIPALDVETTGGLSPSVLMQHVSTWLQTVQSALGVKPLIYTTKIFWDPNVQAGFAAAGYPLWIAYYGSAPPLLPSEWSDWAFWQYGDTGSVTGITGPVDVDHFNGGSPCTIG
jgi:lysozyme